MKSPSVTISDKRLIWSDAFLVFLGGILVLRLVIWKFFRVTEIFFREEFSNVLVVAGILFFAVIWATIKFIRSEPIKKTGFELPVFLLMGSAVCSLFYTADFPSSLMGVLVLGAEIAFFYMLVDAIDTPKRIRWTLFFLLVMALVVAAFGIKEFVYLWTRPVDHDAENYGRINDSLYYVLVNRRVVSFLGWPNSLAGYLLLILPLVLVLPFRLKSLWQRIVVIITWPVFLACFLFTFSFLGWMSLILATLVLLPIFWVKLKINAWPKERKRILLLAIFIFCGLFLWVILRKNFLMSLGPRLFYYQESFGLLAQKPFLGQGWGTFGIMCRQFATETSGLSTYAHNSYLQVWVEAGILGFFGLILLVLGFFRKAFASIKAIGTDKNALVVMAIVWGLAAFFIDNLFSFTMLKPNIALYGWTMLAVFCALTVNPPMSIGSRSWLLNRLSSGGVLLTCALMLVILIRIIGGYAYYYEARYGNRANAFDHVADSLVNAEKWDSWSSYLSAASGDLRERAYMATGQMGFLREAEGFYLETIRRSPNVYVNYFIIGNIYTVLGNQRQADAFYGKARDLSPVEFERDMQAVKMRQEEERKRKNGLAVPVKK